MSTFVCDVCKDQKPLSENCGLICFDCSRQLPVRVSARLRLEDLKGDASKLEPFLKETVLIFSREHGAFWRPNGSGYTQEMVDAGRYGFEDAWGRSSHCGPEKGIEYLVLQ